MYLKFLLEVQEWEGNEWGKDGEQSMSLSTKASGMTTEDVSAEQCVGNCLYYS